MKLKLEINKRDSVIFVIFSLWLTVDTLNGYLLRNEIPIPLSQIYKLVATFLVAIRIYKIGKMSNYYIITFFYLSIYGVNVLINGEELGTSLILISKFVTTLLFFAYFVIVLKTNQKFFKVQFKKVIKINGVVFLLNIFAGLLGVGYNSYGELGGFGYCGFFYAINEMSGVIASIFPWVFYYYKVNYSRKMYLVISGILFAAAFMLSTKSGIVATVLSFIMITYFYGNRFEKRLISVFAIALIVFCIVFIQIILSSDFPIMQRFSWFLEKNGAIDALTSNRLIYWEEEGGEYINSGPLAILFGLGGNRTVEMDPYDALLNMGLIGFFLLLFFYCKGIIRPISVSNKTCQYGKVILSSNVLLIITSIIAGHILFSSMAGLFIAMSNSWIMLRNEKDSYCS